MYAQAVVNERQETASLWVDTVKGNDANPGSKLLPLQTIGAAATIAVSNNQASIGTLVTINPGTYRESITLQGGSRTTSLPMTFQAAIPGTVTVSGATPYTSWNKYNSNIYTTAWAYQWGLCPDDPGLNPYEAPIVLRQEMVYVNGAQMTEVLSLSQVMFPGTFFVDEVGGLMYLWPPVGTNPSTADVEVATLPSLLLVNNMNGVVVRNMAFTYSNSCHHSPAVMVNGNSQNVLFDTVNFDWNNGQGLAVYNAAANVSVMSSTARHNGAAGFEAYQALNILWQNDTASYNNWRGAQGVYYEWGTGGAHIFSDHNETWTNFTSTYNQTHSIHWDTDDQNITVTNMVATGNLLGTLIEKNLGPTNISNSIFCGAEVGLAIRDSSNVTLNGNIFYNNSGEQILINGIAGGFPIANWATGQPYTTTTYNTTITNNVIEAVGSQQLFSDSYLNGADWTNFAGTLTSSNNTWWNATNGAPFTVPTPGTGTLLNFADWQGLTGQDMNSTFGPPAVDPSIACAAAPVDFPDWWLVIDTFQQTFTSASGLATTNSAGQAIYTAANIALGSWTGTATLAMDGLQSMPGGSVSFNPPTLTANSGSTITVSTTSATPPGTYALTVLANSGSVTRTMALNVTVPQTAILLSTAALNYPNQPLKIQSAAQNITVTNFGTTPITFASWVTTSGFAQTNTCGTSLAAGKNCTISVTFTPHVSTPYSGSLTITDSDATQSQVVTLTGTSVGSPTTSLSAHSLALHGVDYLSTSAPQTIVVTNTGTGLLNVSSIVISGPNASNFHEVDTCGAPVEVTETCAITVTLTPTVLGSLTATVNINSNSTNNPASFSLTGSGVTAIKVSPNSVNFGTVNVGSTGSSHTITISNLSTAALSMNALQVIGANPGDFVIGADTCGSSLAGSSSCTVTLTYAPTSGGSRNASLSIVDSDPGSPQSVTFTGLANAITVNPSSVGFGNVTVGNAATKTVTVTNAGTGVVTLSSIQISGANAGDFTITSNTCGSALAGGTACTVTVSFGPLATGSATATLTVTDSDLSSPTAVSLTGTGK
jgi:hypothetical protein